jgi:hypothetical protein
MKLAKTVHGAKIAKKAHIYGLWAGSAPRRGGAVSVSALFDEHAEGKNTQNAGHRPPQSEGGDDRP